MVLTKTMKLDLEIHLNRNDESSCYVFVTGHEGLLVDVTEAFNSFELADMRAELEQAIMDGNDEARLDYYRENGGGNDA